MQIIFSKEELDKIKNRLSLVFNHTGLSFDGVEYSWEELDDIKEQARRTERPMNRAIIPTIINSL